ALATVMSAAAVVPVGSGRALMAFNGDFLFFVYVIALGRFFTTLATLDTDSNLGVLGAGRYVYFAALMEPAFLMITAILAMHTTKASFSDFLGRHEGFSVAIICAVVVLMMSAIVETGRMPIDDQASLNRLSVFNNSMPLHYSGVDLAMMCMATALKLTVYTTLVATMMMPLGMSALTGVSLYVGIMLSIAVAIGVVESVSVRLTTIHVAQFIIGASAISLIALAVVAFGRDIR
ncbi:MAG: NADH-quinone oxidoreductase subunit H, partial [Nitrospirae bacterium]|nr:NADH-quinone oxidoreductase subunit H [Nitrospirota bacterium]